MWEPSRRNLLMAAGAALTGSAESPAATADKVNVAVIGLGHRGKDHITLLSKRANIVAVCDVNQASLENGQAQVKRLTGVQPKGYKDLRRVYEDKDVQAVFLAIPNHWHALAAIWACQAGKDVYVEKPACHNPYEGRKMVEAARKYNRVAAVGAQSRSMAHKMKAIDLLHRGIIGKVYLAKGLCYKFRPSIGRKADEAVPAGLDWDMFLGPAPARPYNVSRYAYNWNWFWETGSGDIGNQGPHEMDMARWALGKQGLPKSVVSTGGKYVFDDDQETPNTQIATFDYGDSEIVFEVRGLSTGGEGGIGADSYVRDLSSTARRLIERFAAVGGGNPIGNLFYGSDGWMAVNMDGFQVYQGQHSVKIMDEVSGIEYGEDAAPHFENFLAAVRTRDQKSLNADIAVGVTSANLIHMANLSYRLKRVLNYDDKTGTFINDAEANACLTRKYRAPYIVPEQV